MSSHDGAGQEHRGILALQAFLSQEDEARLLPLCLKVSEIDGFDSDLKRGARLHITLATWEVTRAELALAQAQFASRLEGLAAIAVTVSLGEERGDGNLACALLPQSTEALLQWHAQVHAKANWPFQSWREMDLPGSWWPHMGLCHIAESKEHLASEPLQKLREIKEVTIERIGLVSYLGPMEVLEEVKLRRTVSSP
jgi:hypothetical protein